MYPFLKGNKSIYMPNINVGNCAEIEDCRKGKVQNLHYDAGDAQLELKSKCNARAPVG